MSQPPSSEPPSTERPPDAGVEVVVHDEQDDHPIDTDRWARLAVRVLEWRGVRRGELALTFVDEETIARLNVEHMGGDGPTDVLSFPLDTAADEGADPGVPTLLGDVVICPSVAAANATSHATGADPHPGHPDHDGSLDAELALLVVHGVLHVLGFDHAEPVETVEMHGAERELLAAFAAEGSGR